MVNDPYQILGVSRDASEDEIRQAYRRLARHQIKRKAIRKDGLFAFRTNIQLMDYLR